MFLFNEKINMLTRWIALNQNNILNHYPYNLQTFPFIIWYIAIGVELIMKWWAVILNKLDLELHGDTQEG